MSHDPVGLTMLWTAESSQVAPVPVFRMLARSSTSSQTDFFSSGLKISYCASSGGSFLLCGFREDMSLSHDLPQPMMLLTAELVMQTCVLDPRRLVRFMAKLCISSSSLTCLHSSLESPLLPQAPVKSCLLQSSWLPWILDLCSDIKMTLPMDLDPVHVLWLVQAG